MLEEIVLETVRKTAKYISENETVFLYLYEKKHKLSAAKELTKFVSETEAEVQTAKQDADDLKAFLENIRECTDIQKLTPTLVNTFIKKIEIFNSVDDIKEEAEENESNFIKNQKTILEDYCKKNGITNYQFFVDDGISGTTFNRPDFKRMEEMVEAGLIGRIVVKDLSRFDRVQVEMRRLTQVVYPTLGVTFISLQENVNSKTGAGMEMMPFYNIFNEWYAAQTSQKIRQVWKTKSEHGERVSPTLQSANQKTVDLHLLLTTIREITEVKELTSGLIHSLIERIEVHNNDKFDGHCHVKVDIYFSVIGIMDIPDEKEIRAMMEEVKKNPQKYRYVA